MLPEKAGFVKRLSAAGYADYLVESLPLRSAANALPGLGSLDAMVSLLMELRLGVTRKRLPQKMAKNSPRVIEGKAVPLMPKKRPANLAAYNEAAHKYQEAAVLGAHIMDLPVV